MGYPNTLLESLRSRRVVPFVGAGVSREVRSATTGKSLFPSWRELLFHAADALDQENKPLWARLVRTLLEVDEPDYLQSAKVAKEHLGATWFEFLKKHLDHSHASVAGDSLQLARLVWNFQSNLVITTNYDRVLSWANEKQGF